MAAASHRLQPEATAPVVSVVPLEAEQVAQDQQAVAQRRQRGIAVDVQRETVARDVGRDRVGVATGATAADRAGGQSGTGESEEEAQEEETVGEWPERAVAVEVEGRECRQIDPPREDAAAGAVLGPGWPRSPRPRRSCRWMPPPGSSVCLRTLN